MTTLREHAEVWRQASTQLHNSANVVQERDTKLFTIAFSYFAAEMASAYAAQAGEEDDGTNC